MFPTWAHNLWGSTNIPVAIGRIPSNKWEKYRYCGFPAWSYIHKKKTVHTAMLIIKTKRIEHSTINRKHGQ